MKIIKLKNITCLILGLILISSLFAFNASAAEFRVNEKMGNVVISQDKGVKNLYTAGNMISINGDIEKSLYIGGNIITINGDVEGNIFVGGNTIIIKGDVGDSVHAGGSSILIEGNIAEDLFIGGGNITISESASIGGDLIIGGGTVDIQGPIAGNILLGGGQIMINSKIGGDIKAQVDELFIGSQAEIAGNLKYSSPKEADIEEGSVILGEIDYKEKAIKKIGSSKSPKILFGILTIAFLIKLLTMIASGLILVYFFKNITQQVVKGSLTNFWSSLGRGFATLILTPIVVIILLITVIGIWLAGLVGIVYVLMVFLALSLASIVFGSWLIKIIKKQSEYKIDWQAVVTGVIVLALVTLIPLVGWFIGFIFVLISLGTLYRMAFQGLISKK